MFPLKLQTAKSKQDHCHPWSVSLPPIPFWDPPRWTTSLLARSQRVKDLAFSGELQLTSIHHLGIKLLSRDVEMIQYINPESIRLKLQTAKSKQDHCHPWSVSLPPIPFWDPPRWTTSLLARSQRVKDLAFSGELQLTSIHHLGIKLLSRDVEMIQYINPKSIRHCRGIAIPGHPMSSKKHSRLPQNAARHPSTLEAV